MANPAEEEVVRSTVVGAVMRKFSAANRGRNDIDEGSKLLELGLIDSEDLIEIILDVEAQCGCEFDPQELDLETGLTLGGLVRAFLAKS